MRLDLNHQLRGSCKSKPTQTKKTFSNSNYSNFNCACLERQGEVKSGHKEKLNLALLTVYLQMNRTAFWGLNNFKDLRILGGFRKREPR